MSTRPTSRRGSRHDGLRMRPATGFPASFMDSPLQSVRAILPKPSVGANSNCGERQRLSALRATICTMERRFLTLADVQEILNISSPQAYALVRSGDLPAIQVGGRGQWRIEAAELEKYIERQYAANQARIQANSQG